MVAIPKIVLKSQTRMTLNERFTQYSEQQHARVQMLKNDLHTRITEDAIRRNGGAETAELSRKLDNLQRVIESQIRRKSPSPQPARRNNRYSPEPHRPATYGRYSEGYGDSMIVPEYRALLYHGGSGGSGGGSSGGGSGSSWRDYGGGTPAQGGRKSRYDLTYGDVIQGSSHRDYDAPSSSTSLYADALDRVPVPRRPEGHSNSKREYRDYWPSSRPRGGFRGGYSGGGHGGASGGGGTSYGTRHRPGGSPRTYADERGRSGGRDGAKRKYDNPLMRDSSGSDNENNDEDQWVDQDVFKKRQRGIKSRLGVRSRLPFKSAGGGYTGFGGFGNGFLKRGRGGGRGRGFNRGGAGVGGVAGGPGGASRLQRSRSFTRPITRNGSGNVGGPGVGARSRSQGRPAITKEDLDKELDEYHRKKGITDDAATMQVDS